MLGTHDLPLFILSGILLNITPGADSLYIATRSATQGVRAGIAAALGISAGCYVHICAAAFGLSALLATSSAAFTAVKFAGAAYLVYVGLSLLLRSRPASAQAGTALPPAASLRTVFAQGLLTNVLNPKVALFFLAFVPQFIEPSAPDKALAFIFLGTLFSFNGTLWCLFLAWASARIGALGSGSRAAVWLNRSVGAVFVYLGVRLALDRQG
ncbi:LysE family translocator [Pseudothauera rhizosphaerae]|uniref:LysE family translocator n=1 Tax=Pseudothauera rhizosphaerae TaxID=2565932 RepID=A0A4V3WAT7_9RHOO|nr:LysE family translocator [Pseudothauera rhizosphaerae]THF60635.1 LysE family translocator [Pseudothauera rhizosphaerae]